MEKAVCDQVIKDCIIMHALKEAKLNLHGAISVTLPNFSTFDFVTFALLQRQFFVLPLLTESLVHINHGKLVLLLMI